MMSALPTEKGKLRQMVEVFENERYIPLSGWGKGLLPADPQIYGSREALIGAKTLLEYENLLLTAGWEFEAEGWTTATEDLNTDEHGWSYSLDFGGFTTSKEDLMGVGGELQERSSVVLFDDSYKLDSSEMAPMDLVQMEQLNRANAKLGVTPPATPTRSSVSRSTIGAASPVHTYESKGKQEKSLTSVVRRRRLTRWMEFHPLALLSDEYSKATSLSNESVPPPKLTCDHCDYQELDKLAGALLKALTEASLVAHPRLFDEVKINKLKSAMLACLDLKQQHSDMVDASLLTDLQRAEEEKERGQEGYSFQAIVERLDAFITGCKSGWATISGSIGSDSSSQQERQAKRESVVATYYYSKPERDAVAEMIIRGSDRKHLHHCDIIDCGSGCRFAPRTCPHPGCCLTFSAVHLASHDEECPYKPVPCTRGCTEIVSRPAKPPKREKETDEGGDDKKEGQEGGEGQEKRFEQTEQTCLIPRRDMAKHLEFSCPLRPVECPYGVMGCIRAGLVAMDLVAHLEECSISHSLLLVERVRKDGELLLRLEAENAELKKTVAFLVEADSRTEAKIDTAIAGITSATTAKFLAIQKASKESEKLYFQGVERKFDAAEEARRKEIAVERDRTNTEFRKIAEALKTMRASTNEEFRKIAQAAQQEKRSNSKK